jgi:hypothetical protein
MSTVNIRNDGNKSLALFWLHSSERREVAKGIILPGSNMNFQSQLGHEFRLYWKDEGIQDENSRGVLESALLVDHKLVYYPKRKKKCSFRVLSFADFAIEVFWVRAVESSVGTRSQDHPLPAKGKEVLKGVIGPGGKWIQTAEFGHRFNFYKQDADPLMTQAANMLQHVSCLQGDDRVSLVTGLEETPVLSFELM